MRKCLWTSCLINFEWDESDFNLLEVLLPWKSLSIEIADHPILQLSSHYLWASHSSFADTLKWWLLDGRALMRCDSDILELGNYCNIQRLEELNYDDHWIYSQLSHTWTFCLIDDRSYLRRRERMVSSLIKVWSTPVLSY